MSATVTNIAQRRKGVNIADVFAKLAERALEEAGPSGQVRDICLSPEHGDSNPSCDYDLKKNCWHCKVCDEGGGFRELVLHAKPDLKTKTAAYNWLKNAGLVLSVQQLWENADTLYDYVDEDGKVILQVGRWNGPPKSFSQRIPDGQSGWKYELRDLKRRVPFLLRDLLQSVRRGETLYVCEGEKDCLSLYKFGLMATTNPQGAKWKWPLEWADFFKGAKRVVVIADNDKAGREAAWQRAGIIARSCADVHVIESLPGVAEKGDVTDWLATEGNDIAALEKIEGVKAKPYEPKYTPEAVEKLLTQLNVRGVATFFKDVRGHKVCWRPALKKWARYRRGVWTTEHVNAEAEVLKAVDVLMAAATDYSGPKGDDLVKLAEDMHTGRGLRELLQWGRGELGRFEYFFDAQGELFNCANGTLDLGDLEKLTLRKHSYADWLTLKSPVEYLPGADCPKFEKWLRDACNDSEVLFNYMQQVMGSCLEGHVGTRRFYFIFGPAGTGKSTFVRILESLLGPYGCATNFKALSESKWGTDGNAPSPALARLKGRRMVTAAEAKDTDRLDVGLIKSLIGGDSQTARNLNENLGEFKFEATLIMSGNEMPKIIGDESIWDKFKPVPFAHEIESQDLNFEKKQILPELSGILNFAIEGLRKLRAANYSLPDPPEVVTARETEMDLQDPFAEWFASSVEATPKPNDETSTDTIYATYVEFCSKNKTYPFQKKKLTRWLKDKRGIVVRDSNSQKRYVGIRPKWPGGSEQAPF
jgi:P4 family phage/plasmid primase-like protien